VLYSVVMHKNLIHSEHIHEREQGRYIGDIVYGANDGIITTFAVISGAAGASFSPGIIITLGLANLVADGISMGVSNYLAIKSRLEYEKSERAREEHEIAKFPEEERAEVLRVLKHWKIPEPHLHGALDAITGDRKLWVDFMMKEELNIIEDKTDSPAKHGLATFISFAIAGSLPLLPFLIISDTSSSFSVSIVATSISLFIVGAGRTYITGGGRLYSGLQMFAVGMFAAGSAYIIGMIISSLLGVTL